MLNLLMVVLLTFCNFEIACQNLMHVIIMIGMHICTCLYTMDNRAKTKLWLLDKNPPIFCDDGARGFNGSFPPTAEEVLLQVYAYKRYSGRVGEGKERLTTSALSLTSDDLQQWWAKTGIKTKTHKGIMHMIKDLNNRYSNLSKIKKRHRVNDVNKRTLFLQSIQQTFWIVDSKTEQEMAERVGHGTASSREIEDFNYLQSVKGASRTGTLGSLDNKLVKTTKRRRKENEYLEKNNRTGNEVTCKEKRVKIWVKEENQWITIMKTKIDERSEVEQANNISETTSDGESQVDESMSDQEDDNEVLFHLPTTDKNRLRKDKTRRDVIPPEAFVIADKYGISNRALTELAAVFMKDNLDDGILSVKTTERRRKALRKENAEHIEERQIGIMSEKFYVLHWDAKKLKALMHTEEDTERIAVVLTGT